MRVSARSVPYAQTSGRAIRDALKTVQRVDLDKLVAKASFGHPFHLCVSNAVTACGIRTLRRWRDRCQSRLRTSGSNARSPQSDSSYSPARGGGCWMSRPALEDY